MKDQHEHMFGAGGRHSATGRSRSRTAPRAASVISVVMTPSFSVWSSAVYRVRVAPTDFVASPQYHRKENLPARPSATGPSLKEQRTDRHRDQRDQIR